MGKTIRAQFHTPRFWWLTVACCLLPDVDVVGLVWGIPYEHVMGHRGFSHSLLFALMVGVLVPRLAVPHLPIRSQSFGVLVLYFSCVTMSHGILDSMTDGGLGIAFFAPFDSTRHFFPWRPLAVSPIGLSQFFSSWGMGVLLTELIWIGIPVCLWFGILQLVRREG